MKIRHNQELLLPGDCMSAIPSSLRRRIRSHISTIAPPVKRLLSPGHSPNLPRSGICPSSAVLLFPFYEAFVPRSKTCSESSGDFEKTPPCSQTTKRSRSRRYEVEERDYHLKLPQNSPSAKIEGYRLWAIRYRFLFLSFCAAAVPSGTINHPAV
jgi:hypothetical protein